MSPSERFLSQSNNRKRSSDVLCLAQVGKSDQWQFIWPSHDLNGHLQTIVALDLTLTIP